MHARLLLQIANYAEKVLGLQVADAVEGTTGFVSQNRISGHKAR
jgi:hypothetical protein